MEESIGVMKSHLKEDKKVPGEQNLLYALWYDEKIDKAKQGS